LRLESGASATEPTARGDEKDDERHDHPERDEKPDCEHAGTLSGTPVGRRVSGAAAVTGGASAAST
jgi:hypothetical protein